MKNKVVFTVLFLFALSCILFMLGNGRISFTNNDEVFYMKTAKEMAQHGSWLEPYLFGKPQFEKPILTYALLRLGVICFGPGGFGGRFFPAVFAAIGVITAYLLSLRGLKDQRKALLSGLVLMSAGLYVGLAKLVFTDMIFSVFVLLSLASFYWGYTEREKKAPALLLFFVFSALAVLTKGPLGIILPLLAVVAYLFLKKDMKFLFCGYSALGLLIFAAIAVPWYVFMINKYGRAFTYEFFYNDHIRRIIEAEHKENDTWHFYPLTTLGCMFPWSLFVLVSLIFLPARLKRGANDFHVFLVCWIGMVFVIFQGAHSKLVSYVLPLYPALAALAADFICDTASVKIRNRVKTWAMAVTLAAILLVTAGALVYLAKHQISVSSKPAGIFFIVLIGFHISLLLFFTFKNDFLRAAYCLSLSVPIVFLAVLFSITDYVDENASSKKICEYLLKNYSVKNTVLCSKFLVRGVGYYIDNDIAAMDIPNPPFFSPHPIPHLNTDEKVADFLRQQTVTYCILKKSAMEDIERIKGRGFVFTVLKKIGNEYLVKVEHAG